MPGKSKLVTNVMTKQHELEDPAAGNRDAASLTMVEDKVVANEADLDDTNQLLRSRDNNKKSWVLS